MDEFAVGVMTGIQMRTVAETFVSVLIDDCSKVFFIAETMSFGLLTLVPRAVVAVLQIAFALKLGCLYLFFVAGDVLELHRGSLTSASMSIFSPKREGALSSLSMTDLASFSLGVSSFFCC
jgi:hypothetical protein